jgi:cell wall-associated NlpC family hydrolase
MLSLYEQAAPTCPGLAWTVLAAIGTVESDNGRSGLPGVHSGRNFAGAEGPMQFEPATFAHFDRPVPAGGVRPSSPYDPVDAVYAAARMLCADGARDGAAVPTAVFAYDHSESYVQQVLAIAASYGGTTITDGSGAARVALAWALRQLGTPYVWGGETPGVGFDCSGLVQAAYRAAGIALPRVAQDQFDAGPRVPGGSRLEPGDLVFFGASPSEVTHVGMVVRPGVMVDAPHTGAAVRVEPFPTTPGTAWGDDIYIAATRPAG